MKQHQVTIKDIAKVLGYSVSTVSRALKNHQDISAETRKLVQETAKELKYKPNLLALSLRKNKTNTIGVLIPEIVHHFFSSVISGIEDIAYDKGYNVIVCQSNENYDREVINAQALISNRVDGVLASISKNTFDFEHYRNIINQGIPLVFFDRICPEINSDRVIINDEEGAFMATEHLIKIGCKNIAHFAAPENLLIGQGRLAGYKRALKQYSIPFIADYVLHCDTRELSLEKTLPFIKSHPEIDGIFAVNDSTAISSLQIVQKMGKNVPKDIAIIGFGDGPNALISKPTLSTIEQKGYEMGAEAMSFLFEQIDNEKDSENYQTKVLSPSLVIRESTSN